MAQYNRSPSGKGYIGIPAWIFVEMIYYGRGAQTHEEKRTVLHKIYSYLRGYLPVLYDKDGKTEEYNLKIHPLLVELASQFTRARELYKPTFEGIKTCDPDEIEFQTVLEGIFERLAELCAISRVIDKEKLESDEMLF